jgi:sporulation protein YlmC with PRC-barrel domain
MNKRHPSCTALIPAAVALALSAPAFGAMQSADQAQTARTQNVREMRASNLIGQNVKSPQGNSLGEINDLVVDMNTGKVRYAILAFDPGIFSGERLFAVPTNELKFGSGKNEIVYNMTRERLERAGVERRNWPNALRDRNYLAGLDRTYGIVQPSQDRRAFSASELLGKDVNGRQGDEIGEIRDLVVDMNGQRVHYAVLAFDPSWAAPEKLYAFPLSAFTFTQGKDELALNVDKAALKGMRSFDHTLWSAYAIPAFVTDVDRYLVTITPMADPASASGKSSPATGASSASPASSQGGSVVTTSPRYTEPMKRLQDAAQKLRESIQALAQAPVGEARERGIKQAHQALYDTNQAMIQLPPELRSQSRPPSGPAGATSTSGGSGGSSGAAISQAEYNRAMDKLQKSAQQLRDAIQAMAQQPAGDRRNQAINEAHQALNDTNQAMVQLPSMRAQK